MPDAADPQRLTLAGLAHRCAQETELFFQGKEHDSRFCFELFRRAIVERNQRAWELLYTQYHKLVAGWVRQHPLFATTGEEAQYFVNRAVERMWGAVKPEKFEQFADIRFVLRYLQMCTHSVIIDYVRRSEFTSEEIPEELGPLNGTAQAQDVEEEVLGRVNNALIWRLVSERLNDEKERQVVYGCFVLDLPPRELYARTRQLFSGVDEIYRIKQNVLARLRRDPELVKLILGDA